MSIFRVLKMVSLNLLVILLLNIIPSFGSKQLKLEENVNDLILDLEAESNYLYDPNDMLAEPKIDQPIKKKNIHGFDDNVAQGDCEFERMQKRQCMQELESYTAQYADLQFQVMREKNKSSLLLGKLTDSNHKDISGFYTRILRKFWNLLNMEANEKYVLGSNDALIRYMVVKFSARDIAAFKQVLAGDDAHNEVDLFFTENVEIEEREELNHLQSLKEGIYSMYCKIQSFEFWLTVLWILIFVVLIWAFYLFVRDIQKKLRWRRVLLMALLLVFLVSYVHHWRHMIKVRESQRHSMVMKMEIDDRKSDCLKEAGFWALIKEQVFGAQSDCEKYHEKIMILASEEVSPMMVLSETISNFILLPLKDMGFHLGLFFTNFYRNIPLLWHIPATMVLMIMVVVLLFTCFGYGIRFPFWLGGIQPARAEDNSSNFKKLIKQSEESMKTINQAMINEAKDMLTQISHVAITQAQSSTSQPAAEAIVQRSTTVIEKKLEDLINRKLSSALELHSLNTSDSTVHRGNPKVLNDVVDWAASNTIKSQERTTSAPIPIPWKEVTDGCQRSSVEETGGESSTRKEGSRRDIKVTTNKKGKESTNDDDFIDKVRNILEEG